MLFQHFSYPTTLRPLQYGFTLAVPGRRADANRQKLPDDLPLRRSRYFGAAAATASVLHGEVKRRRARLVFQHRIGAGFEKAFHRGGTARTHGAVERRRTILILRMDIRASVEQA